MTSTENNQVPIQVGLLDIYAVQVTIMIASVLELSDTSIVQY